MGVDMKVEIEVQMMQTIKLGSPVVDLVLTSAKLSGECTKRDQLSVQDTQTY